MPKLSRVKRNVSQAKDATSRTGSTREDVVALPWGRMSEREPKRGAGPYEVQYEVALGYCCERSIVLP